MTTANLYAGDLAADAAAKVLTAFAGDLPYDSDPPVKKAIEAVLARLAHLEAIARASLDARRAQKEYYRAKGPDHLHVAKDLERRLDRLLQE
jgi:hypothetical protein